MKFSKKLLMSALLLCGVSGGVMVAVAEEGEVWQQGGLATNQVSSGTAKAQKALSQGLAAWGFITGVTSFVQAHFSISKPGVVVTPEGEPTPYVFTGSDTFGLNWDVAGASLDIVQLNDARTKEAQWSKDIPELQSQIRHIGSLGSIESECEKIKESGGTGGFFCNMVSATLDETEVHVSTLKNVGLEALEDVAESPLTQAEELIGANPVIQAGFGTKTAELQEITTDTNKTSNSSVVWSGYITDFGSSMQSAFSDYSVFGGSFNSSDPSDQMTEEEKRKADFRRKAHIQMVGTAGVARADLASSLAASEKAQFDRLSTYIGSGGGSVVANTKVLVSLDLTLAQRLNLLNMVQGQQVANEAASALQMVE